MKELTHKQMSSRGGKAQWKGLSKARRHEIMKDRWAIRKMNKEVKEAINKD